MSKKEVNKSVSEINRKIEEGNAVVVTAEEMVDIVDEKGKKGAAEEVDVVTTGTFGAMCSSGAWLNFGHADPPIKLNKVWLNDVEAYAGGAAVDAYIGATALSESERMEYGGGHVIEELVRGREIDLRGKGYGTDSYPRKEIETSLTIDDLNQAILSNPRNSYQKYNAATNSRNETIHTYMGTLLPNHGNISFSGSGELSPLNNDPEYQTIGIGSRIFLGGGQGYIFQEGTQHSPKTGFGTIMTVGDLNEMSSDYIRGVSVRNYGVSLFVGIGIPIPVLNEDIAESTGISDEEIKTNIMDYGTPRREKPKIREVNYKELKSGKVEIGGEERPVSPMSSLSRAREISQQMKEQIQNGEFFLSKPARRLSRDDELKPMKQTSPSPVAKQLMTSEVLTAKPPDSIKVAAEVFAEKGFDHLPVVNEENKVIGIVTSWDVAVALGNDKEKVEDILTSKVVTAEENEPVDSVARKLQKHEISGMPVIDTEQHLKGIITSEDLSKLIRRGRIE